jgi:hypothetical protein
VELEGEEDSERERLGLVFVELEGEEDCESGSLAGCMFGTSGEAPLAGSIKILEVPARQAIL